MGHFAEPFRQQQDVFAALVLHANEHRRYELISYGEWPEVSAATELETGLFFNLAASYLSDPIMPARLHSSNLFQNFVSQWRKERNPLSSLAWNNVRNPAYMNIIGMGRDAVPFILRELRFELQIGEPDDWFVALWAITRENPVPTESRGNVKEMARAWIEWGLQQGFFDGECLGAGVPEFGQVGRA